MPRRVKAKLPLRSNPTALFLIVNLLVMLTLGIILSLFGVQQRLGNANYTSLLIFCCVIGMGGAFISLLLSRFMAKMFQGVGSDKYVKDLRVHFDKVLIRKPAASRKESREVYLVAKGFKGK